jgi:hypothetical protein
MAHLPPGVRAERSGDEIAALFYYFGLQGGPEYQRLDSLIRTAAGRLPMLNFVVRDHCGLYAGHVVTLGLHEGASARLARGVLTEEAMTVEDLADVGDWRYPDDRRHGQLHALHLYSFLAVETTYAYRLLARFAQAFVTYPALETLRTRGVLSRQVLTGDSWHFCKEAGLAPRTPTDGRPHRFEPGRPSPFYSCALSELPWLGAPGGSAAAAG